MPFAYDHASVVFARAACGADCLRTHSLSGPMPSDCACGHIKDGKIGKLVHNLEKARHTIV